MIKKQKGLLKLLNTTKTMMNLNLIISIALKIGTVI